MKKINFWLFAILFPATQFLFAPAAYAENNPDDESTCWTGEIDAGGVGLSGNSKTTTLNANAKISCEEKKWLYLGKARFNYAESAEGEEAWAGLIFVQTDFRFSEKFYLLANIEYEEDHFSGYRYRGAESAGVGLLLVKNETVTIKTEVGAGGRHSETDEGKGIDEFILRGAAFFSWNISQNATIAEEVILTTGSDGLVSESTTTLATEIAAGFGLKISIEISHNSNPPDEKESTDTRLAASLLYRF